MKKKLVIILFLVASCLLSGCTRFSWCTRLTMVARYINADLWRDCVDFMKYENEFTLVKDYVEDYMNGQEGTLSIGHSREHAYDLYDNRGAGAYLNCPEEIRAALKVIACQAFDPGNANLRLIVCTGDQIEFHSSRAYVLCYNPFE